MKKIEAFLVDAFTANGDGGNPAGVVLNADRLTDEQKLKIAQAVGYSETAFVSSDEEVDFSVSFFTTTDEVDFCGHATLAAFSVMYQEGLITKGEYVQRTKVGLLSVTIEESGKIVMEQQLPKMLGTFSYEEIAPLIGISRNALASTNLPIEVISTGLSDIIVPVPLGYLDQIQPNNALISDFCQKHNLVGIHAFELCEKGSGITASCRNFAPLFGIPEESATGSSCGALACYLSKHFPDGDSSDYVFEQGRAMNCTSSITARVEYQASDVTKIQVGGFAHEIGKQTIII